MKRIKLIVPLMTMLLVMTACNKEDTTPIVDLKETPDDYLSDKFFDHLTIEIVSVQGFEPNANAVSNLENFLDQRLNKPKGISFIQRSIPSPQNYTFSVNDIRALEEEERTQYRKDRDMKAYIFYADTEFSQNTEESKTLGLAYGSSSMVLFKKTINDYSGGLGQVSRDELESAVLIHEFCHVLGLVNNGTPMVQNHQDTGNPGHCDNSDCLMYYASKTNGILNFLMNGSVPELDSQCLADLKANGGK